MNSERAVVTSDLQEANERLLVAGVRAQEEAERADRTAAEIRAVLENLNEGVAVFDTDGAVVSMNARGRALLGLPAEGAVAVDDLLRFDVRGVDDVPLDFSLEVVGRALAGAALHELEVELAPLDGARRRFVFSGSVVRDAAGSSALAVLVYRDVTSLRELELTREQYLSLVTHDLRGPLSSARLAAQVIAEKGPPADRVRHLARRIVANLDRTDAMVRDLLDVTRVRAGELLQLKRSACDITAIAREVVDDLVPLHGERFAITGDERVAGDFGLAEIRRAIWNLATNAVKYGAADRPITIDVRANEEQVTVSVHNEGPVIPEDEQARLFLPFARTHAAMAASRGWGLGLTLVRGAAEAHGGTVKVHSDGVHGTTFTVVLPRAAPPATAAADEPAR